MKYELAIRKIEEADLRPEYPIPPEEEDFEMYLSALVEDIKNINVVTKVMREANNLIIEIRSEQDFSQLHSSVLAHFKTQYLGKLVAPSGFVAIK